MTKDQMIQTIVDDLDRWLKDDYNDALEHFQDLERKYLQAMSNDDVDILYDNVA